MSVSGARKAAMLLMSLEPSTAAELLKSAKPDMIAEIAAELAGMRSAGPSAEEGSTMVQEFFTILQNGASSRGTEDFLRGILDSAVGKSKSQELMGQVQALMHARDPFRNIRNAELNQLAAALAGESGPVAGLVLSELTSKKSQQLLGLLADDVKGAAVRGMTAAIDVSAETRRRVADLVEKRLAMLAQDKTAVPVVVNTGNKRETQLRKVALLLRGLKKEARDGMLKAIQEQDAATHDEVLRLMVVWEDVPQVADRTMQEVLRTVEGRSLALALVKADPVIASKVRSNISERACAMLEEESSLLSNPKEEDIEKSRQAILDVLRDINSRGELQMAEG